MSKGPGSTKRKERPAQAPVAEADVPKTSAIRGKKFDSEAAASEETLIAGSLVRVMRQHACSERTSEYLKTLLPLDARAFVFCALHAHMRLSEALVKDMFGRAIESRKVERLRSAFERHLGITNKFQKSSQTNGWNKVSLYGYECWRFGQTDAEGVSKIERVIKEVWPAGDGILGKPADSKADKRCKAVTGRNRPSRDSDREQRFLASYCALWQQFNLVVRQMRCKNPHDEELKNFGVNCRDLGARWCMLLPANRCSTFYLHTLMMHGGEFMEYCLERGVTVGMLENSGAERRHEIGRVMFKKSLSGGGKAYRGMRLLENRSAYLTLRGILIWQYGRDMLASMAAQAILQGKDQEESYRGRNYSGWKTRASRQMEELFMKHVKRVDGHAKQSEWADRNQHDDVLALDKVLDENRLSEWDLAEEGAAPPKPLVLEQDALVEADASFVFDDGTAMTCADCRDDDAESCESGLTGSSDRGEWELQHDDFGDLDDYQDDEY